MYAYHPSKALVAPIDFSALTSSVANGSTSMCGGRRCFAISGWSRFTLRKMAALPRKISTPFENSLEEPAEDSGDLA